MEKVTIVVEKCDEPAEEPEEEPIIVVPEEPEEEEPAETPATTPSTQEVKEPAQPGKIESVDSGNLFDNKAFLIAAIIFIFAIALLITHRKNIGRLLKGEEKKLFGKKD